MPGLEESISRDTSPPTHSLMSDGIGSEQVKKFLFTSRKAQDNVQCNESLEIYIPEVMRTFFPRWTNYSFILFRHMLQVLRDSWLCIFFHFLRRRLSIFQCCNTNLFVRW